MASITERAYEPVAMPHPSDEITRMQNRGAFVMVRSEFDHFLLTRFNIRYDLGSPLASDPWLRERLCIFRQWTLPSVMQEADNLDGWLIFCDARSPEWFRYEVTSLLTKPAEVIWVDGAFGTEAIRNVLEPRMSGKPFLITTRLDNDDAISCDFFQLVQGCFDYQDLEFINLTYGIEYEKGQLYLVRKLSNPFVSLIEKRGESPIKSVYVDEHQLLSRHGKVREVRTHPAWIQNIHGGNLANRVTGVPVSHKKVLHHFSLQVPRQSRRYTPLFVAQAALAMLTARRTYLSRGWARMLLKRLNLYK